MKKSDGAIKIAWEHAPKRVLDAAVALKIEKKRRLKNALLLKDANGKAVAEREKILREWIKREGLVSGAHVEKYRHPALIQYGTAEILERYPHISVTGKHLILKQ
ncbi:hypothetical protein COU36_03705 [Candidatus Micrarchaeota archaeon CG10_big_fil_rev_8_21_14_0_10_59_7]|nr:MAG: hypothetical protein COU36_03705 [Candidatus Micrarchaeota archaeon CG10_big_fil_rev_8_21_14_0_10_59_7]